MMRFAILGAGGHGQVVADALRQARKAGALDQLSEVFFLDEDATLDGSRVLDLRVIAGEAVEVESFDAFVVAIGDNRRRREVFDRHAVRHEAQTVRHPASVLASDVIVEPGCMIMAGVIVNTGTRIGRNTILNTGCSIDHHASIGDHVHIAPGVRTGGNVTVGEGAFVGVGAVLLPGVAIGAWATVGAGAVVLRDVPPGVTVVGNPARQVRK